MLLVQQGAVRVQCGAQSRQLKRGDVYFVAAGAELQLEASADVTAWVAACNGMAFADAAQ
jgi:quercetin dioxygenase-like cupin family protein